MSLANRPDWKIAPEWARYLAMDRDGSWWWFEHMPRADELDGIWFRNKALPSQFCCAYRPDDNDMWAESLEDRPSAVNGT